MAWPWWRRVKPSMLRHALKLFIMLEFPLEPMGALAPGSAHARPSAQAPLNASGQGFIFNFSVGGGMVPPLRGGTAVYRGGDGA